MNSSQDLVITGALFLILSNTSPDGSEMRKNKFFRFTGWAFLTLGFLGGIARTLSGDLS